MPVIPFEQHSPVQGTDCFIAPDAWIIGKTTIESYVSIFFSAVLRGDINSIKVGTGSNIQEHALLHTSTGLGDCIVGENVTIGHRAIIHGATIGNQSLIGMGATILDGAQIGDNSMIGANSLVTMNSYIPQGVLAVGTPAKVVRDLTEEEIAGIKISARHYQELAKSYIKHFKTCQG